MMPRMIKLRFSVLAVVAVAALAVGCGTEKTDVTEGVEQLNSQILAPQGAELDCPKEVDGGEGETFECTMKATNGDASAPVTMKIVEEDGELAIDIADEKQFDRALEQVTKS